MQTPKAQGVLVKGYINELREELYLTRRATPVYYRLSMGARQATIIKLNPPDVLQDAEETGFQSIAGKADIQVCFTHSKVG